MKNYLKYVFALFVFASFYACSDDDVINTVADSGTGINFGMRSVDSRTIYESTDSKQILWNDGDQVRIFCAQAFLNENDLYASGNAKADYTVTRSTEDGDKDGSKGEEGTIKPSSTTQLRWGYGKHQFYAVYPANNNITVNANGIATFPINRDQKCYIQTDAEKAADNDASKYTYVARPDMSNAYMVASTTSAPTENAVWLDFKPVMTTLNIVVKGPQNLTPAGTPDDNSTADPIVVTGVSIISTITSNSNADKSTFMYDIKNNMITGSATGSGTATKQTETTFVSIVNTDGLNAITLNQGETLALTAFLPPMASETAETLQRDIKIRVHTTGGNKTMTLADATALTPSAKGSIKLPSVYTPISGSNWITPLDDDIYVSQLSIPGTHDAASKECTSVGRTQDLTIEEQLNMGIRAFDLRPTCPDYDGGFLGQGASCLVTSGNNAALPIYHGIADCNITLADVFTIFNKWLNENPKEFIIVTCRWEEESNYSGLFAKYEGSEKWSTFEKAFTQFLNNETYYPKKRRVEFKPDLTIGDMRSDYDGDGKNDGKILIICRPSQGSSPDSYYTGTDTSVKAIDGTVFVTGWPANQESPYVQTGGTFKKYYEGASVGTFMCQDYYQVSDEAKKFNLIKDLLNISNQSHINSTYKNIWFINHCSGYENGSWIELWPSVSEYATNARDVNQEIFKYLMGETTYNNEYFSLGSTGIMYLDFVGSRYCSAGNYLVYGDLLPQAIIDNNYKYRMNRKGE